MARKSKIIAGLEDAVQYARGDLSRGKAYRVEVPGPIDVRAIREKLGLSQAEFAQKFGFPLAHASRMGAGTARAKSREQKLSVGDR